MTFSAILDLVLGIILLFLILSIIASATSEYILNFLNQRARSLQGFIKDLINGTPINIKEFYENTVIASQLEGKRLPSYIKAEDFSTAMMELIRVHFVAPSGGSGPLTVPQLKDAIVQIPKNSKLKRVMVGIYNKGMSMPAEGETPTPEVQTMANLLEEWYDNSMQSVSSSFKRNTQLLLLVMGISIAVIFNVDTIAAVNYLLKNPAIREAISAQASVTARDISAQGGIIAPVQATPDTTGQPTPAPTGVTPSQLVSRGFSVNVETQLKQLNIPFGWPDPSMPANGGDILYWLLGKLVGWTITVLAISQGAPFWFDLLNKITNVRYTSKPKEPSAAG